MVFGNNYKESIWELLRHLHAQHPYANEYKMEMIF